jgi:ubiquinone/menaquinone biosynthesis C-methylase UbiE
MNEKLLEYFNEIEMNHWWWEGRRQILRQTIKKEKNLKILDIGCGTGETLSFLKTYLPKPSLYGIDSSPTAIKYAMKRGHKNIISVDAKKLPFENNKFDYILLLDVLEHIKDDTSILIEARRVLKKNGKIIITTPALQFIWSEHDTAQGHFRRYVRRRIRKITSNSKLSVKEISYFNFFLSPAIIGVRLLSKLKPFKKYGEYNSKLNFSVAKKPFLNELLKSIFVFEVKLIKYINYPFGISIFTLLEKEN